MLFRLKNKSAQSALVYAAIIAIIAFALILMSRYVQRAIQGKHREAGDIFGMGEQYESGVTDIDEE